MLRSFGRPLLALLGFAVGGLCLWLATRDVDWREAERIFRAADPGRLALAFALYGTGMTLRAVRWRGLIAFRHRVGYGVTLRSLLAGYAVNSILPARLGELFRADFMARQAGLSRSSVLASIFVERLLDLIVVVGQLAVGLAIVGGGGPAVQHVLAVGTALILIGGCALYLVGTRLSHGRAAAFFAAVLGRLPGGQALARQIAPRVGDFAQLLQSLRGASFLGVSAVTLPIWLVETAAIWMVCRASGVGVAPGAMLCLMGAANLSTLLPTAPGYAGSYQFAFVLILGQFAVGATAAVVAATTVQVCLIGGYTLLGLGVLLAGLGRRR